MTYRYSVLKACTTIGLIVILGMSMDANAGILGFGGTSWKEEVLLHDGNTIIVERSFSRGGRHEIGQGEPIKEQAMSFTLPASNQSVTWKSDYSDDVGRSNFNLLAVHILNGTPYVVASPNLCLSYNKWGRPNPPYVFFKYDGKDWQRIPLAEAPVEFREINVVITIGNYDFSEATKITPVLPPSVINKLNSTLTQPEYKTILREPLADAGANCGEMVSNGKGLWVGMGWFRRQPSYAACMNYCSAEDFSAQYCPCATLFKGK